MPGTIATGVVGATAMAVVARADIAVDTINDWTKVLMNNE